MLISDFLKELNKTFHTEIQINNHKNLFKSVKDYLQLEIEIQYEDLKQEILDKMIELDTIIEIQIYPKNSVGFYTFYGYDLNLVFQEIMETFKDGIK